MKLPQWTSRRINPKFAQYRLRVGHSRVHRYGVFAVEDIPSDRKVIEYTGRRLPISRALAVRPPWDVYVAKLNFRWAIDPSRGGSGAQFINHSCNPNLRWRRSGGSLYYYSRRKIRAGEELTVNYRLPIKIQRVPCKCGDRKCRGTLRYVLT